MGPVLTFVLGAVFIATLVSGLVPAILASRGNAAEMMKEGGRGNSSRLVNIVTRVLVIGQIAFTAALLIAGRAADQVPLIYFAVAVSLSLVAAASCFVPARRATRVDPIVALRAE